MRLREMMGAIGSRLCKWSTSHGTSSRAGRVFHQTDAPAVDQEEDEEPLAGTARQLQHFGFRSIPVAGSEIVVLATRGFVQQSVVVASDNPGHGPAALQDGEVCIYNKVSGTQILLDKDGNVSITTTTGNVTVVPGAGKQVQLGDSAGANLDAVALFTQLKSDFDGFVGKFNAHIHPASMGTTSAVLGAYVVGNLSASVASSNVVAKK